MRLRPVSLVASLPPEVVPERRLKLVAELDRRARLQLREELQTRHVCVAHAVGVGVRQRPALARTHRHVIRVERERPDRPLDRHAVDHPAQFGDFRGEQVVDVLGQEDFDAVLLRRGL
eukprot:2970187-Rhodomonas_salina.1